MLGRALAEGMRSATRRPGLVAVLWAWNLALAATVTLPFWAWISAASGASPGTDVLLDGADIGVITQLLTNDARVALTLFAAVAGLAVAALVSGAFLSGGILEVVTTEGDGRPLLHRFFRGAGHFFGRFLRLLVIAGITLAAAVAAVSAILAVLTHPLAAGGSEPAALWATIVVRGGVALTIAFFVLALDYARAATVLSDSRSMFRAWLRALVFVVKRTPAVATMGALAASGVLATIAVTTWYDLAYKARAWGVILGAIFIHQAMVFVRTAVRVGHVSAQVRYCAGVAALARARAMEAPTKELGPTEPGILDADTAQPVDPAEPIATEPIATSRGLEQE